MKKFVISAFDKIPDLLNKYLILFVLIFCSSRISGQNQHNYPGQNIPGKSDVYKSDLIVRQKEYLTSLYFQAFGSSYEFVSGKEYFLDFYGSETTSLLFSGRYFNTKLLMDGKKYENIRLQYDTYLDDLIFTDTSRLINSRYPKIVLNKAAIDGFNFYVNNDSLIFKHLRFSSNIKNKPEDGFYEVVYNGPSKYLVKHQSTIYMSIREAVYEYKYTPKNTFIIDNTCFNIKKNKEFLKMFSQHSQEIKELFRRTKINVKKAGKQDIAQIIKYYDSLVKSP